MAGSPDNSTAHYPAANRPAAVGVNGMVASAHPLASTAGLQVLMDGGNAFDAAVTTAAVLGVGEPYMSGMGGIGVALVYTASDKRVRALNFSGRAPKGADPTLFTKDNKDTGAMSPLVPGNVAGWLALHEAHGSMDRERLFRPAIAYAEGGVPVTRLNARTMANSANRLRKFSSGSIIVRADGSTPSAGDRLCMPRLADSFRAVVKGGTEEFYTGDIAERLVKGVQAEGGLLTMDDMAGYCVEWQEPVSVSYRDFHIYATPPNSSGFQILQTLKLMEGYSGEDLAFQAPETLHVLMECMKLAITDRIKYAGDPDFVRIPVKGLLSDGYAARQRDRIDRNRAAPVSGEHFTASVPAGAVAAGSPDAFDGGMTTHFAVMDRDGNVVSITQTLGGGFGSGFAPGDTGIFLNNMCHWFDLEEDSPNRIGPGKRVDFVVAPTHTFRGDQFYASMGTPGSWGILQTTPQFLMHLLDFGMNPQEAIEAPRFRYYGGVSVEMEGRFPQDVRKVLEQKGHDVTVLEPWSMSVGGAQGFRLNAGTGTLEGGADPRRDGLAVGW